MSNLGKAAARNQAAETEQASAFADLISEILEAKRNGMSITKISEISGVSRVTIYKHISANVSASDG